MPEIEHSADSVAFSEKDVEPCSICLESVKVDGIRSTAKLKCGHDFHLDCIGSAFNAKGSMQCPNCRQVEDGQWLYAASSRNTEEFSFEDYVIDDDIEYSFMDLQQAGDNVVLGERQLFEVPLFGPEDDEAASPGWEPYPPHSECPHSGRMAHFDHRSQSGSSLDYRGETMFEPSYRGDVLLIAPPNACPYMAMEREGSADLYSPAYPPGEFFSPSSNPHPGHFARQETSLGAVHPEQFHHINPAYRRCPSAFNMFTPGVPPRPPPLHWEEDSFPVIASSHRARQTRLPRDFPGSSLTTDYRSPSYQVGSSSSIRSDVHDSNGGSREFHHTLPPRGLFPSGSAGDAVPVYEDWRWRDMSRPPYCWRNQGHGGGSGEGSQSDLGSLRTSGGSMFTHLEERQRSRVQSRGMVAVEDDRFLNHGGHQSGSEYGNCPHGISRDFQASRRADPRIFTDFHRHAITSHGVTPHLGVTRTAAL